MPSSMNTWLLFFLSLFCGRAWADPALSLTDVIKDTVAHHPTTQADQLREAAKLKDIGIARATYMPNVSFQALETQGFPGSAGATNVEGLMVSPFHHGAAAGFVVKQTLWDFGRTSGRVTVAEKESDLARSESDVNSVGIAQSGAQSFYTCAKDQSLVTVYDRIRNETQMVVKEVISFVSKGQRSVVDRYLSESQAEEANTFAETYRKRLDLDYQELSLLMGKDVTPKKGCPPLSDQLVDEIVKYTKENPTSPYIDQAQKAVTVAGAQKSLAQKDFMPTLVAMGSFGSMQGTELNYPKKNWSFAIGLIFPLFEGFKTKNTVERNEIEISQRERELAAVQQNLKQTNIQYDRLIESTGVRIKHLKDEVDLAEKGFSLARTRYLTLKGDLIDLREGLRNLARTYADLREAQALYLSKLVEKSLIDGKFSKIIAESTRQSSQSSSN